MLPQTAFVVWTNWYVSYFGSLWLKIPPNTDALPHCLKMSHSKSSILFFFSPPRCHRELCLDLKLKSHRGRDPEQTAGHSPSDLSTFPPHTCYYSGMQGGDGDRVTAGYPSIKAMKRGRASETAMETEWPRDDKYQQEQMNHKSSRDSKAAVLNAVRQGENINMTKSTRKWEINVVKKWHGYPTESLSDLRLIGTHQCRQLPGHSWPQDLQANL